ncbi:MAG: cupredoxin domain-containing protein [Anaerolineales bacterium]|nr:cupredoxin domain-containing protein [Chloroflexota bacterium]MBL6980348.1 cupredoxin domain-containing protein [Anaerolineales bacterium]
MKRFYLFLIISVVALILAACSAAAPEPVNLTIELSEYAFSPTEIELQVGQEVTFTIVNVGALEHEIMFGREVNMMENRPNGYSTDMFESAGVEPMVMMETSSEMEMEDEHEEGEDMHDDEGEHKEGEDDEMAMEDDHEEGEDDHMAHDGFMVFLPAGNDTATISFTVTEEMVGEWEIGCFELDGVHYDAGMVGKLVVNK